MSLLHNDEIHLQRNTSRSSRKKFFHSSSMTVSLDSAGDSPGDSPSEEKPIIRKFSLVQPRRASTVTSIVRSIFTLIPLQSLMIPTCRFLHLPMTNSSPSLGRTRRVTGTLFGSKKGHVSFAVQEDPRSEPVLLLELATPTSSLVKEMASGLVRIALECERRSGGVRLFQEPMWTMYCNGRKSGYAVSRACGDTDLRVLRTVQTVSIGAGVIPASCCGGGGGELMYMRARFERVVGSRDSEAFYMLNPDGNGGPELSIFLLRI